MGCLPGKALTSKISLFNRGQEVPESLKIHGHPLNGDSANNWARLFFPSGPRRLTEVSVDGQIWCFSRQAYTPWTISSSTRVEVAAADLFLHQLLGFRLQLHGHTST